MANGSDIRKTILDYFPNYLTTDALFTKMVALGAPWGQEVGQDMDAAFFTYYSGIKTASGFVRLHQVDGETNTLTIARILLGMYNTSWSRLWEAYKTEYSPLNNYDVTDTTTRKQTNTRTINRQNNGTSNTNTTDTTEYGQTIATQAESKAYTVGFNSTSPVPSASQTDTGNETHGGTDTITGTVQTTTQDIEDTMDDDEENETVSRTRLGNIGQNTYQELMKQEFELWKWNYFKQVFDDVDSVITVSVSDLCSVN